MAPIRTLNRKPNITTTKERTLKLRNRTIDLTSHGTDTVGPFDQPVNVTYPDEIRHLKGDAQLEYFGSKVYEAEAQGQVPAAAAEAATATQPLLSAAAAVAAAANSQLRNRNALYELTNFARKQTRLAQEVLLPLRRHPNGDKFRYWMFWVLLGLGDAFGGALVLIKLGEHPLLAIMYMIAVGLAVVTLGMLGRDIRQSYEWRAVPDIERDESAQKLIDEAFRSSKPAEGVLRRVVAAAVLGLVLVCVAAIVVRAEKNGFLNGFAFGGWSIVIGVASWINGYTHADPAGVIIDGYVEVQKQLEKQYESAPIEAIEEFDQNLAAARLIVDAKELEGAAAFRSVATHGLRFLADNPQLAGHCVDEVHRLVNLQPDLSCFDRLNARIDALASQVRDQANDPSDDPQSEQTASAATPADEDRTVGEDHLTDSFDGDIEMPERKAA